MKNEKCLGDYHKLMLKWVANSRNPNEAIKLINSVDLYHQASFAKNLLIAMSKNREGFNQLLTKFIEEHINENPNTALLFRDTSITMNVLLAMVIVENLQENGVFKRLNQAIKEHILFDKKKQNNFAEITEHPPGTGIVKVIFKNDDAIFASARHLLESCRDAFGVEGAKPSMLRPILMQMHQRIAAKLGAEEANKQIAGLVILRSILPIVENSEENMKEYNSHKYQPNDEANARATVIVAQAIVTGNWQETKDKRLQPFKGEGGPIHREQRLVGEIAAALVKGPASTAVPPGKVEKK